MSLGQNWVIESSAATVAFRHGNKRRRAGTMNHSLPLIDSFCSASVGFWCRREVTAASISAAPRAAGPCNRGDTLKDNNKAGMRREISGVIRLD